MANLPSCSVCGGSTFSLLDGNNICDICGAHQTSFADFQEEENYDEVQSFFNVKKLVTDLNKSDSSSVKFKYDWSSYEAYNVILKKWCKSLECLGASSRLSDVVLTLWILYLKECRVGFLDDYEGGPILKDQQEILEMVSVRDLESLGKVEFEAKERRKYSRKSADSPFSFERKLAKKKRDSTVTRFLVDTLNKTVKDGDLSLTEPDEENDEDETEYDQFASSMLEQGIWLDDTTEEVDTNAKKSSDFKRKSFLAENVTGTNEVDSSKSLAVKYRDRYQSLLTLTLPKLVGILYLGILLAREDILLFEVLQWCKEGKLPYFSSAYLLSDKFSINDNDLKSQLFRPAMPFYEEIIYYASGYSTLLHVQAVPLPPLRKVLDRFIAMLNMPEEILEIALTLIEVDGLGSNVSKIPSLEIIVASSLILSFKLMVGLDGTIEYELSQFANQVNSMTSEFKFFSWVDWHKHINQVTSIQSSFKTNEQGLDYSKAFWSNRIWEKPLTETFEEKRVDSWSTQLLHSYFKMENSPVSPELFNRPFTPRSIINLNKSPNFNDPFSKFNNSKIEGPNFKHDKLDYVELLKSNIDMFVKDIKFLSFAYRVDKEKQKNKFMNHFTKTIFEFSKFKNPTNTRNRVKITLNAPEPFHYFNKIPFKVHNIYECPFNLKGHMPTSFLWMVELLTTICHSSSIFSILHDVQKLENGYITRCQRKHYASKWQKAKRDRGLTGNGKKGNSSEKEEKNDTKSHKTKNSKMPKQNITLNKRTAEVKRKK